MAWHTQKLTPLLATLALIACSDGSRGAELSTEPIDNTTLPSAHARETVDRLAASLVINYKVVHNKSRAPCTTPSGAAYEGGPCYEGELTLQAGENFSDGNWSIYYSQVEPLYASSSDEFTVQHINGDLHRIKPTEAFDGFEAGEEKTIHFIARGHALTEAKLMPNYYVVADEADPKVIASTKISLDPETGLPTQPYISPLHDVARHFRSNENDVTPLATAQFLFDVNQGIEAAATEVIDRTIIPTPKSVTPGAEGKRFDFSAGVFFDLTDIDRRDVEAPIGRLAMLGVKEAEGGAQIKISVAPHSAKPAGAYKLKITENEISVVGVDAAGAAYGLYSIASLVTLGKSDIPTLTIEDAPRYAFRGLHVDTARNFHSKETILKLMDQMAAYKLNKLHLHLADDEGWRLEIPGLPELTEIGSKRCYDRTETKCIMPSLGSGPNAGAPVNGYFSVAEYSEILNAASARHIEVIPSLDMPGHARAAVKAMEARYQHYLDQGDEAAAEAFLLSDPDDTSDYESIQFYNDNTINPCMESTYAFIAKVIDEVKAIHARANHPLKRYHVGADETAGAWKDSPICEAFLAENMHGISSIDELGPYFIERVAAILNDREIEIAGWSDGIGHVDPDNMPSVVQSNIWSPLASTGAAVAHEQANRGWDIVLSFPDVLYFDFPYEADPKEGGYYWAARRVNTRKVFEFMPDNPPIHAEFWKNASEHPFEIDDRLRRGENGDILHAPRRKGVRFAGIQGQIWSETIASQSVLEYRAFPRLIALAERAWHRADWEVPYNHDGAIHNENTGVFTQDRRAARDRDWARFASALAEKEFAKLDRAGLAYRIPTVGAKIEDGVLDANLIFPGLDIEFREVGKAWRPYADGVKVTGPVEIRAVAPDGKRKGRSLTIEP